MFYGFNIATIIISNIMYLLRVKTDIYFILYIPKSWRAKPPEDNERQVLVEWGMWSVWSSCRQRPSRPDRTLVMSPIIIPGGCYATISSNNWLHACVEYARHACKSTHNSLILSCNSTSLRYQVDKNLVRLFSTPRARTDSPWRQLCWVICCL